MCIKKVVARAKRYKFFQENIWGRIFAMKRFRGKKVIYARINRRYITKHVKINAIKLRKKPVSIGGSFIKATLKMKSFYFGMTEFQLKSYVRKARHNPYYVLPFSNVFKPIRVADNLASLLELRLDNVLARTGLASPQSLRQLMSHRKILVNNKIVTKSSFRLNVGDVISFKEIACQKKMLLTFIKFFKKTFIHLNLKSAGVYRPFIVLNNLAYLSMSYNSSSILVGSTPKFLNKVYYPFSADLKKVLLHFMNI